MTKTNVFTALAKAQSKMSAPAKDAVNQHFRNTYADLASVVEAVAPALNSEGIAFFHMIEDGAMVTVLHHGESDTEIRCAVPLIVNRNDMQGFKSATTYAKRIGLESVTGVAPDDDDGNDAARARPPSGPRPVENAPRHAGSDKPNGPTGSGDGRITAEQAIDRLRACQTMEQLRSAFVELKARAPEVARLENVVSFKDKMKGAIEAEGVAAQ